MHLHATSSEEGKTAVILVAGFLGAGKTTLLKRVFNWRTDAAKTVVLVNEFGKVGIDGELLRTSGTGIVELTSGCICCTLSADLKQSLLRLREDFEPHRIFIEASGVADPTTILSLMQDPQLAAMMQLQKVVTVLDADFWEARDHFGPLFYHQLEAAHLILLNKIDQVDPSRVSLYLKEMHAALPDCQVIPTVHCAVDAATLFAPVEDATGKPLATVVTDGQLFEAIQPGRLSAHAPTTAAAHFSTFSFVSSKAMDQDRFHHWLQTLPLEVFRIKGTVRYSDGTDFINFVGGKWDRYPWSGEQTTRLALIAWNVDIDAIERGLRECLV